MNGSHSGAPLAAARSPWCGSGSSRRTSTVWKSRSAISSAPGRQGLDPGGVRPRRELDWRSRREEYDQMFHHAKVFACAMRRFGRLREAATAKKMEYPANVAEAIKLAWKKARVFFDDYREVRDAIEHIDG